MGHFHDAATRATGLLLASSLLMAGCSSSSDSPALSENDTLASDIDSIATTDQPEADPISSEVSDEVIVSTNDPIEETSEPVAPTADSVLVETSVNEQNSEPTTDVVPDPLVQNRTQVDFGITVPAYQSDALQVRLTWGDTDVTAGWVGDELWSTSLDLPTDTENTLFITFSDNDGEIELASYSQNYRTGVNAVEFINIGANQFNSEQFDADGDGVSNLEELIAGSDPTVDEDSLLEIVDFYTINSRFGISVTRDFESRLPDQRPFFEDIVLESGTPQRPITTIDSFDIDAEGNGTHIYSMDAGSSGIISRNGTRTHSLSSISWAGVQGEFNGISGIRSEFTSTVTVVDESTREFVEEIVANLTGDYGKNWETSTRLIGNLIEGSSMCEPVAGMGSTTFTSFRPREADTVTTFSKAIDDLYWRVVLVSDGVTSEFFARELKMVPSNDPENGLFICDFVDI